MIRCLTLADLIKLYMQGIEEVGWPGAHEYYRKPDRDDRPGRETREALNMRDALNAIAWAKLGHVDPNEFGPMMLRKCQAAMVEHGLARKTVNARCNRLRRFFRWAVSYELVSLDINALEAVPALKKGRTKAPESKGIKSVSFDLVKKSLEVLPWVLKQMVMVHWYTGMRPGELVIMRRCDLRICPDDQELWEYRPAEFKSEHHEDFDSIIYLGPMAQDILRDVIHCNATQLELFAGDDARDDAFLWRYSNATGIKQRVASYRQAIQKRIAPAGLPRWTPLQIRHAFATRLHREGQLKAASEQMNHTDTKTTQIYIDRDRPEARAFMKRSG